MNQNLIEVRELLKMRKIFSVAIILVLSAVSVFASDHKSYGNVVVSKVVSVYDAYTFRCNIEGWPAIIGKSIPIRVNGIDTPEMKCKSTYSPDQCRLCSRKTNNRGGGVFE